MDKTEANEIINNEIKDLRKKPYNDLAKIIDSGITKEVKGKSRKLYQLEIQAFWDDKKGENLRVSIAIDDGGWRAFIPITNDFIISPNGEFIGE